MYDETRLPLRQRRGIQQETTKCAGRLCSNRNANNSSAFLGARRHAIQTWGPYSRDVELAL